MLKQYIHEFSIKKLGLDSNNNKISLNKGITFFDLTPHYQGLEITSLDHKSKILLYYLIIDNIAYDAKATLVITDIKKIGLLNDKFNEIIVKVIKKLSKDNNCYKLIALDDDLYLYDILCSNFIQHGINYYFRPDVFLSFANKNIAHLTENHFSFDIAKVNDLNTIILLHNQLVLNGNEYSKTEKVQTAFNRILSGYKDYKVFFLKNRQGKILGTLAAVFIMNYHGKNYLLLEDLVINKTCRKGGYGYLFFKKVIDNFLSRYSDFDITFSANRDRYSNKWYQKFSPFKIKDSFYT